MSDTEYVFSAHVYACLEGSGQCAIDIPVYQNTRLQASTTGISTQSNIHSVPVYMYYKSKNNSDVEICNSSVINFLRSFS